MIISKIRGGLGNQLFEWAAGTALSEHLQTSYALDLEVYGRNKSRDFELREMGLPIEVASSSDIETLKKQCFYRQPHYHYDESFCDLSDNTYLRGYFCSERYFLSAGHIVKNKIWNALSSLHLSDDQIQALSAIENKLSVSLHVRRGDYVSNNGYNDFFGTCDMPYYRDAIETVASNLDTSEFVLFVFSDDLNWCRKKFTFKNNFIFVDVNAEQPGFFDLLFMARCQHNIIANSTFSWWGAWLNRNHEKTVVAPKRWFKVNYREKTKGAWIADPSYSLQDLFPKDWTLV